MDFELARKNRLVRIEKAFEAMRSAEALAETFGAESPMFHDEALRAQAELAKAIVRAAGHRLISQMTNDLGLPVNCIVL